MSNYAITIVNVFGFLETVVKTAGAVMIALLIIVHMAKVNK